MMLVERIVVVTKLLLAVIQVVVLRLQVVYTKELRVRLNCTNHHVQHNVHTTSYLSTLEELLPHLRETISRRDQLKVTKIQQHNMNETKFHVNDQFVSSVLVNDDIVLPKLAIRNVVHSAKRMLRKKGPVQSELIPIDGNASTSIVRYLEEAHYPHMITVMKWNSKGILERTAPIFHTGWWPYNEMHMFNQTKPSENGTVAFFLGTDVLAAVKWKVVPPIPFLVYSLPNTYKNDGNPFSLIPTPYDRTSFNRACIGHAEQVTLKTKFHERKNVIIWRGIPHGTSDPNRNILFNMSKEDPDNIWLDAVNIKEDPTKRLERHEMAYYKYQIDIGGASGTTWGGLRWKMCSGNLIFKVDSWARDWWYDTIEPWKHYIPVKNDLSDLHKQYIWAENHPNEAYSIVQNATKVCKESVSEEAVVSYQKQIFDQLRPATIEQVREADAVIDGLGSFYESIIEQKKKKGT